MSSNVRKIWGGQQEVHQDLNIILDKHSKAKYLKPIASFNIDAFNLFKKFYQAHQNKPILLDLGCGTAQSSVYLAENNPDCIVIGIDRSAVRLTKIGASKNLTNLLILRTDIEDFIRLFVEHGCKARKIYFFYPNPYPKKSQINKRWYAHPLFSTFLKAAQGIEVRSNWRLYIQEFFLSLEYFNKHALFNTFEPKVPVTPFELKYSGSGQTLYRLISD